MEKAIFNKFRKVIYDKSGINLKNGKEALVCTRVSKRMRTLGIDDYRSYLRYVMQGGDNGEIVHLIDVISTNVTSFFREAEHFAFLGNTFANWFSQGQKRFRFWSAACSSGEEPYSITITLNEILKGRNVEMKILATDISTQILKNAREGIYSVKKLESVPENQIKQYFNCHRDNHAVTYSIKTSLKEMIVFSRLNLSSPPFPMHGPFDVIFCRNVMIYFDDSIRKNLLDEIYRLLRPGGYLIVGSAESLAGMMSDFKLVKPSIYLKL